MFADKAISCPTNVAVDQVNNTVLNLLPGEEQMYYSDDELHVPMDVLNSIILPSLPPYELKLKIGTTVMLLRNSDLTLGRCNGTRLKVLKFYRHLLELEILTGSNRGEIVYMAKIKMRANDPCLPDPISKFQFPVNLTFALTKNKAQGQTLRQVGVYLKDNYFAHGQLYVACSRVSEFDNLMICIVYSTKQGAFYYRGGRKCTRK